MASNSFTYEDYAAFFTLGGTPSTIQVHTSQTKGLGLPADDKIKYISHERVRSADGDRYAKLYQDLEDASLTKKSHHLSSAHLSGSGELRLSQLDELEEATTVGEEIMCPHELEREETTNLYSRYYSSKKHQYDTRLPITACKEKILEEISVQEVVVIQGSTGCGKTTQVPQYILDSCAERGRYCNIAVTQPRRIAAISIAQRVCHERGWRNGTIVGYQVGMDKVTSEETRLCYMTTGVLLQKLVLAKNMNAFTHIIIDEVHERDQDTDLTMLVVRKFLRTNSRSVKVILMSATIDTEIYSKYYSSLMNSTLDPAPVVSIEGKPLHVSEFYITDLKSLGPLPTFSQEDPKISLEAYNLALKLILTFDHIEVSESEEETAEEGIALNRGTVLIFLPGYEEITRLQKMLNADQQVTLKRWWILPLHSTITKDEQNRVFDRPQHGYRKIILSTNIAESSITVPDIKYVIDFCLTRSLICDPVTNYQCLQLEWASKANCQQRKGRAGRTSEGRCYRMVPWRFYEEVLPEYGIPEMRRCPLDQSVLNVKKLNIGEPKALLALALEPPNLADIEVSILNLKEVGALATTVNGEFYPYDGDLTFIGHVMSQLPLDIKISRLILLGIVFDCLEECIIIAASLSVTSFFSKPFQKLLENYRSRLAWAEQSFSDCFAYLQAYQMWRVHVEANLFNNTGLREDKWAQNNFIQLRKIRDVEKLVRELKQRLARVGIQVPQSPQLRPHDINRSMSLILKCVICGAFYPNYFVQEELDEKEVQKMIGNKDPLNSVVVTGLPQNQGILYDHRIRDIFKVCSHEMDVDYEEGKAYIQFGGQPANSNRVATSVYVAIKMRELRMPMYMSVFTPAVAVKKMERLDKLRNEFYNRNKALRSNRVKMLPDNSLKSNLKHAPLPGIEKSVINMHVSHITDCGNFFARYSEDEAMHNSGYLQQLINMMDGKNLKPLKTELRPNSLILAPFADQGRTHYFRAIYLEEKLENHGKATKGAEVKVFFIDYGNTENVALKDLREIDPVTMIDVYTAPAQAFKCALAKIQAVINPQTSTRQYTSDANFWFKRVVDGAPLIARVYSVVQDEVRVELSHRLENGQEQNINNELVNLNYAEWHRENYQSQQNHELRIQCSRMRKEDLESFNRSQEEEFCMSISTHDVDQSGQTSLRELRLHGPYSPLEVSYMGMTRRAGNRKVRIERDSVNSVTLDPEPHAPCSRMLVASSMTIASDSSFINCRNTTIMPNIRGLPALMTLLFAPCAEFRTDSERKRYTGAICGLGYNPQTKEPLFEDHDTELLFDTEYNIDDIFKINLIRICINYMLGSEDSIMRNNIPEIRNLQTKARKNIVELLRKHREPMTPMPFSNIYEWGQVSKEHVLESELEDDEMNCIHLLPLHAAIALTEDSWRDTVREQVRQLHRHANRLQITEINKCPLCNITTYTPKELLAHLSSYEHREKEEHLLRD